MALVFRSLVLTLALALVAAGPFPARGSSGNSGSTITFTDTRRGNPPSWSNPPSSGNPPSRGGGSSIQFGETSATSVQTSSGEGQQTNQGQATAVSTQQQSGLGGATQVTNNQGVIQALQEAKGGGGGTGEQSSNNQVNIESNQLQQNVNGTLVNVHEGNQGVVIVNTNDNTGAVVNQKVINNKPIAEQTAESAKCRYVCIRPHSNEPYCCDDGSNNRGKPAIHGGQCPDVRILCVRNPFFTKCGHDGQCAASDKCCYDTCVQHHICKSPDSV